MGRPCGAGRAVGNLLGGGFGIQWQIGLFNRGVVMAARKAPRRFTRNGVLAPGE
jgi:hypothetical protein